MRNSILAFLVVAALTVASTAAAQQQPAASEPAVAPTGGTVATAYSSRGLTLPEGTISIIGGPASNLDLNGYLLDGGLHVLVFQDVEVCVLGVCSEIEIDDPAHLWLGGAIGVMPNLEVGAMILPLQIAPDFEYGDLALYGKYRFVEGDIDVGAQLLVFLPTDSDDVNFDVGVPVRFRGPLRVDTGGYLQIDTDGDAGLRIPATLTTNVTESFYIGGRTGFFVPNFDFDNGYIPLKLVLGYTIGAGSGPVDLSLLAGFPFFVSFGDDRYDELVTEVFQIGLGVNAHFDVF
jgi:hypothetical protein